MGQDIPGKRQSWGTQGVQEGQGHSVWPIMEAEALGQGWIHGLSTWYSPQETVPRRHCPRPGSEVMDRPDAGSSFQGIPGLRDNSDTEKINLAYQKSEPFNTYRGSCESTNCGLSGDQDSPPWGQGE